MAFPVTRSESNRAPLGCGRTGGLHPDALYTVYCFAHKLLLENNQVQGGNSNSTLCWITSHHSVIYFPLTAPSLVFFSLLSIQNMHLCLLNSAVCIENKPKITHCWLNIPVVGSYRISFVHINGLSWLNWYFSIWVQCYDILGANTGIWALSIIPVLRHTYPNKQQKSLL